MKINSTTTILGNFVILVPYKELHVPRYHEWMSSEELQKLTASEPLTLDEEYQMQKSWAVDEDKCTFILLDKKSYKESKNEVLSMIGDTNLFFTDPENREIAEIEIMIAEQKARGKGCGKEATLLMLRYGVEKLRIKTFEAKIGMDNTASIKMFEKFGFQRISESHVFQEITFSLNVSDSFLDLLKSCTYELQENK